MNKETKTCQNCKERFTIEPEDFAFYEKMHVPALEICHECRSQERTAFRNESILYKRKCDLSGKDIISIYSQEKPYKVYDQHSWWGDKWDAMEYSRDFDFSRPFFEQFGELMRDVPRLSIVNKQSTNSDYCNYSNANKDCYLCFGGHENENCAYCWYNWKDKDCFDCLSVIKSELTYESNFGNSLYKCAFCEYCFDCVECYFGYNLVGCQNCFLCTNLRHQQYHFLNQPLSKEEYQNKVNEYLSSYERLQEAKQQFQELKLKTIRNPVYQKSCTNCTGGDLMYCKNIKYGFDAEYCEDGKYIYPKATQTYNSMDTNKMGYDRSDYCYMMIGCAGLNNCRFCDSCWNNHDLTYCNLCFSSGDLFGCVGLKHKQYCILNKQYTKGEYEELISKIIEHMKKTGEWGKFFPVNLSPFAYNETTAQEYTPLTKQQAEKLGYIWQKSKERDYKITMQPDAIPGSTQQADDSILNEVIGCEHEGKCNEQCTEAFKIIKPELEFYKKMNLPLPRHCPNCRHYQRLKQRNPMKLWHRKCQCAGVHSDPSSSSGQATVYKNTIEHTHHGKEHCPNEFETSYASDRPEIVYCEKCYQDEIV